MDAQRASFLAAADAQESVEDPAEAAVGPLLDQLLARQVAEDAPPEVWQTARRLLEAGIDAADVHRQLRLALGAQVLAAAGEDSELDEGSYLASLARLPLPSAEQVEQLIVGVVRERQPIAVDEVDRLVAERLGLVLDDPLAELLLDRVQERLLDDGPLALLASDEVVHVPTLVAGIVLTHRLTEGERSTGVLTATDLPAFDRGGPLRFRDGRLHAYRGEDGLPRWLGPSGWLSSFPVGCLLAVRVQPDGAVTPAELSEEPSAGPELVAAVRAGYDAAVAEPWLPVTSEELLLAVLAADRVAFTAPAPPLSELAAAAGLEQRADAFAHEESVWQQARRADRTGRVFDRLGPGPAALATLRVLALLDDGVPDGQARHELLDLLHAPDVLEVVADELLGTDDDPLRVAEFTALAEQLADRATRPRQRAVALWLAAVAAERRGAVEEAEAQLRAAVWADPGWPAAEDRLAWYESDRGDAAAAAARWRRLGLTAEENADLAAVERFQTLVEAPKLGRNQPCWCGSGRKYKQCHLGRPAELAPLPDRVGWLRRKMIAYLERRGGPVGADVVEYALALAEDADDEDAVHEAMHDALVTDVVLHEGGWLARFLTDRGRLLPDDEAILAGAWLLSERTVIEVLDAVPGREVTVRDLRTGDRLVVSERTFSATAQPGQLLCVRVVPDGEGHQFVGAAVRVAPGTETGLLEVLDEHDGHALLGYVAQLFRPPVLVTGDGEPLVDCQANLCLTDARAARAALDACYDGDGDGNDWVSLVTPADDEDPDAAERTVRAWLQLQEDTLSVRTMSEARLDAVLTELQTTLPGAQVTSRRCAPIQPTDLQAPGSAAVAPAEISAETLQELMDRYERRWCDEEVPALGGLTPRQAAADPTRRDELARLIASFPAVEPTGGAFGLRPARLQKLLGLATD